MNKNNKYITILEKHNIYDKQIFTQSLEKNVMLQSIYSRLKKSKKHILDTIQFKVNKYPTINNSSFIQEHINKHLESFFISDIIRTQLTTGIINVHEYTFTYGTNTLTFYNFLFSKHKNNVTCNQLSIMACYGFMIQELYSFSNVDIITYIYPSTYKKKIPLQPPITPNNINSGYTPLTDIKKDKFIVLFRKEDVENVFVHELIHYLKIDHDLVNSTNTLHTFFNISNTILINEGYTEMLTILYVSLCNSIFLHLDYKDILYHEYIYSLSRCNKVLQLYSIQSHSDIHKWDDETNAFAYIFIKTLCFSKLDLFLQLGFNYTALTIDIFIDFLQNQYPILEPFLFKTINFKSSFIDKSLKKSIYDIKW